MTRIQKLARAVAEALAAIDETNDYGANSPDVGPEYQAEFGRLIAAEKVRREDTWDSLIFGIIERIADLEIYGDNLAKDVAVILPDGSIVTASGDYNRCHIIPPDRVIRAGDQASAAGSVASKRTRRKMKSADGEAAGSGAAAGMRAPSRRPR